MKNITHYTAHRFDHLVWLHRYWPGDLQNHNGNLEVSVIAPQGIDTRSTLIYVDGVFVGNVSERLPVLYLKRGKRQ